jgi:hypothetical protein
VIGGLARRPKGKNLPKKTQLWYHKPMMDTRLLDGKLHSFFHDVIRQSFRQLGIYDSTVTRYMADVLTDFAKSENLYRIRSRKGKRMESVVEILSEQSSAPVDETQLLKERSLRKYLGDYALFMSGIFRNYVEGRGFLDYYIEEGSRSYWTVSELDLSLYRTGFILFQELSKKFEYYSGALDYTRKAYFATEPGEDPFAGFLRQIEGWMKVNLTEN